MKKVRYFCDVCGKEKPTQEYILPCARYGSGITQTGKKEWTFLEHPYISSEKKDICDDCASNVITNIKVANAKSVQSDEASEALKGDLDRMIKVLGDVTSKTIDDVLMEELKKMARGDKRYGY